MPRRSPLHQRHAGALHRDVGAGAHRDADVGLRERRRVVDAVAGHRDAPALRLEPLRSRRALPSGSTSASTSSMPTCARHRLGGRAAVAGQHDDLQAFRCSARDRLRRRRLDRVGDADEPGRLAVDGDEHHRLALGAEARRRAYELARQSTRLGQQRALPTATRRPSTIARTPLPVTDANSRPPPAATPRSRAPADDRRGQRMLARRARGWRPAASTFVLVEPRLGATTRASFGLPSVSVPVLSTTSVSTLSSSSIASALRTARRRGALAGADHDRHRRRQAERAGARDDQHRHGVDERVGQARLRAVQPPDDERDDGDRTTAGTKYPATRVGEPLDRRTDALRLAHHADDLREQRVRADSLALA